MVSSFKKFNFQITFLIFNFNNFKNFCYNFTKNYDTKNFFITIIQRKILQEIK